MERPRSKEGHAFEESMARMREAFGGAGNPLNPLAHQDPVAFFQQQAAAVAAGMQAEMQQQGVDEQE